jgi:hypothetical protein
MYQKKPERHHGHHILHGLHEKYRSRRSAVSGVAPIDDATRGRHGTLVPPEEHAFRPRSRSGSRATRGTSDAHGRVADARSEISHLYDDSSDDEEQDIDEIWYVVHPSQTISVLTNWTRFAVCMQDVPRLFIAYGVPPL